MFILDFDDTLFDTHSFKQARLEAVAKLGISDQEYWQTYRQARNSPDGIFTYSNERHADILANLGYNRSEILQVLQSTTGKNLKDFVFSDTFSFLQKLKSFEQTLILLSLGNPGFQELKTKGSGVHSFFDRVFMIHTTKQHILKEIFEETTLENREQVWFINDKVDETKILLKELPFLKPVLKICENFDLREYKESGLPYFKTLTEIADYVKQNS